MADWMCFLEKKKAGEHCPLLSKNVFCNLVYWEIESCLQQALPSL